MLRISIAVLSLAFAAGAFAAGDLTSGPKVGDKLADFKAHGFSGPMEGKEFAPLKEAKDGPTLLIFVHQITRPALKCLRPIDAYAAKAEKLAGHIVWLGEKEKSEEYLKRAKNSLNFQLPICIAADGKDGPPAYGLNDRAALTILLAKDGKVVGNFAFTDPNDTDSPKVVAAVAKLLGKNPPKAGE